MFVTLSVLKVERSIDVKEEQLENILFIFMTFLVLKLDKLIEFNEVHP